MIEFKPRLRLMPRIAMLRTIARLTQRDLAETLGVEAKMLRAWERGKEPVPDEHVLMLSKVFAVKEEFLLGATPAWGASGAEVC